jgi:hypothetical protein
VAARVHVRRSTIWRAATAGAAFVACAVLLYPASGAPPPSCGWGTFSDSRSPGACWRPFSGRSPFNRPLPSAPRQAPNAAAIAEAVALPGTGPRIVAGDAGTRHDYAHPVYFSGPNSPSFRVRCTHFGGDCELAGKSVRIPNLARPAAGGDAHLAVIDQRGGWEYDFWNVQSKPRGGGRLVAGSGGRTRIGTATATGLRAGATVSGFALSAGVIRAPELGTGEIDHALFMIVPCTNGRSVYPAAGGAGTVCPPGPMRATAPAIGQRFFLRMTDAEIDALEVPAWQKTILRAMADYGMYVGDTGGEAWGLVVESGSSQTSFGQADPWVSLAERLGLPSVVGDDGGLRYVFDMRTAVDWRRALRVAAPCVSTGRC